MLPYIYLLIALFVTWVIYTWATAVWLALDATQKAKESWGGTSIMPGIVIGPLFFTALALGINQFSDQTGFWVVGSLALLFGIASMGYIVYGSIAIKKHNS